MVGNLQRNAFLARWSVMCQSDLYDYALFISIFITMVGLLMQSREREKSYQEFLNRKRNQVRIINEDFKRDSRPY